MILTPKIKISHEQVDMTGASIQSGPGLASIETEGDGQNYRGPFAIMTTLFFTWGFMLVFNNILIPRFKVAFDLTYFQAMLVQFAFYGAYFVGSLIYFLISAFAGDPIARIGYKNVVVIGLILAAAGGALFWPAAAALSYLLFLVALFVMGLGFVMLQIAANPYVTILGPERTASSRLNLAQGFSSIGTTIGPLIAGYLIFQYFARPGAHGAESVKVPYLAFSIIFMILAVVFFFIHLPHVGERKMESGAGSLKYPHVILGAVAIFMYVGGEISIASSMINFLEQKNVAGLAPVEGSKYVSLFWGGLLIGRFMGAAEMSEMRKINKQLLLAMIPLLGFLLFWVLRSWNSDRHQFDFAGGWAIVRNYLPMLGLCWLLFQFGQGKASRNLANFSIAIVLMLAVAILVGGKTAMWCVVGAGLFISIGWSNTFALALDGTGIYKSQVSSVLVMGLLGGALVPPLQGCLADAVGLQISYIVPLIAFIYVTFYGWKGYRIGRNRQFVTV
ncbi:MAG TPA: sugar MFS transporter [Verrucomicrobiae bacterium]|jgi:FHS family L-fucose permease-like MFS transporter